MDQGVNAYIEAHVAEGHIQHNPIAEDGLVGLLAYVNYLSTLNNVEILPVSVLVVCTMVAIHSQFSTIVDSVVFDGFRLDGKTAVEHWDVILECSKSGSVVNSILASPETLFVQS